MSNRNRDGTIGGGGDPRSSSIAIQACLMALRKEQMKIVRDEKLRLKFASANDGDGDDDDNAVVLEKEEDDVVCVEMVNAAATAQISSKTIATTYTAATSIQQNSSNDELSEWQTISNCNSKTEEEYLTSLPSSSLLSSSSSTTTTTTTTGARNIPIITSNNPETESTTTTTTPFGIHLSQTVITDISTANIHIQTPIGALTLAIHAALKSNMIGFICTGIPPTNNGIFTKSSIITNGFAPPIRDLPKGKFLPDHWERSASAARDGNNTTCTGNVIRYRKNGIGATVLRLSQYDENEVSTATATTISTTNMVKIEFGPMGGGEPWEMNIPMKRHVNVDGLNAALDHTNEKVVRPTLHYKSLATLLSKFCSECPHLGTIQDDNDEDDAVMTSVDEVLVVPPITAVNETSTSTMNNTNIQQPMYHTQPRPPTIENDLLPQNNTHQGGDFGGDLLPSGVPLPGFANPNLGRNQGGNLMGMNHPFFQGSFNGSNNQDDEGSGFGNSGNNSNFPGLGGLGMQPRFDAYYPPGVSGGGGRGGRFPGRGRRGRGRGGRGGRGSDFSGDPNNDIMKPPNNLGNDMFM